MIYIYIYTRIYNSQKFKKNYIYCAGIMFIGLMTGGT